MITVVGLFAAGCASSPEGDTVKEKQADIKQNAIKTLDRLYKQYPDTKKEVANAPGYAVFSNVGYSILITNFANGYGVVHNNETGKDTFMHMKQFGLGIGGGKKDYQMVMIFETKDAMNNLIDNGSLFGAGGSASFKSENDKETGGTGEDVVQGIKIYELTDKGFIITGNVSGASFKIDPELNGLEKVESKDKKKEEKNTDEPSKEKDTKEKDS